MPTLCIYHAHIGLLSLQRRKCSWAPTSAGAKTSNRPRTIKCPATMFIVSNQWLSFLGSADRFPLWFEAADSTQLRGRRPST